MKNLSYLLLIVITLKQFECGCFGSSPTQYQGDAPAQSLTETKTNIDKEKGREYCLLSLDGGGLRGRIVVILLQHLEKITGLKVIDMFDGFVGASIGASIVAFLNSGSDEKTLNTIEDLLDCSDKTIETITAAEKPKLQQIAESRFDSDVYLRFLNNQFGNQTNTDFFKPTAIITQRQDCEVGMFYSTDKLNDDEICQKTFTSELVYAACAFPSLFNPIELTPLKASVKKPVLDETKNKSSYGDGGLCASNPCLAGVKMICDYYKTSYKNINIISLGTGKTPDDQNLTASGGFLSWKDKIGLITLMGGSIAADICAKLYHGEKYYRIQIELKKFKADDFSKNYVSYLTEETNKYIENNHEELEKIAAVIKRCYAQRQSLANKDGAS